MNEYFQTANPLSGQTIQKYFYQADDLILSKLELLSIEQRKWKSLPIETRVDYLKKWSVSLMKQRSEFVTLMNLEMGKIQLESEAEFDKSMTLFSEFLDIFKQNLNLQKVSSSYSQTHFQFDALGNVLAIMPWNFPVWQVLRCAIPALLVGNGVALKHSEITAGVGQLFQETFDKSIGLDFKVFINLHFSHYQTEKIIASENIQGVAFTGSVNGGSAVASLAGKYLKKCILELGGSDGYYIRTDADIESAVRSLAKARALNHGQSCVSPKRIFCQSQIINDVAQLFKENFQNLEPRVLAHRKFLVESYHQIQKSAMKGGISFWQERSRPEISYFPRCIFLFKEMNSFLKKEEFFNPVVNIIEVKNDEHAIAQINYSDFGLGGGIFSRDIEFALNFVEKLDVGMAVINDYVKSEVLLPFGGIKKSGFGKELGYQGLMEFVNLKTISQRL